MAIREKINNYLIVVILSANPFIPKLHLFLNIQELDCIK